MLVKEIQLLLSLKIMQPFWKRILSIDLVDLRLFSPAKYSNSICQIFFKTKNININCNEIVYMAIIQGKMI